jgi:hypothetical protein
MLHFKYFFQQIQVLNILNMLHTLRFSLQNAVYFIMLPFLEKKKKKIEEYNEAVHQLFIDFKEAYDSVMREVLCNILLGFSITMKLAQLIKMCLNETCCRVQVGKHFFFFFPIRNGL